MAIWEIRLVDQPPMRVEVENGRNLAREFSAFRDGLAKKQRLRWQFWKRDTLDPYWVINEQTKLHVQMVAGVLIMKPVRKLKNDHKEIGFHVKE